MSCALTSCHLHVPALCNRSELPWACMQLFGCLGCSHSPLPGAHSPRPLWPHRNYMFVAASSLCLAAAAIAVCRCSTAGADAAPPGNVEWS